MATQQLRRIVDRLHHVEGRPESAALTDGQLLDSFLARRDERAFAELVRRHGPMVMGVCRRVLRHADDADDAFQATFLVLVRKGETIRPRGLVGNWLYGVAYRTARKAKSTLDQRRSRDSAMPTHSPAQVPDRDLSDLIDRELQRLPDKYRLPIVLCDLEGRTRKEAAAQLGWPEGTVAGRLARGRAMLAKRLLRLGVAPSLAGLGAALAADTATAAVSPTLCAATQRACLLLAAGGAIATCAPAGVAGLADAVVQALPVVKWKMATVAVLIVGMLGLSAGAGSDKAQACFPRRRATAATANRPLCPLVVGCPVPRVGRPALSETKAEAKPSLLTEDAMRGEAKPASPALNRLAIEARDRYEKAKRVFNQQTSTEEEKGRNLAEAYDLLAQNLGDDIRRSDPEVHQRSLYLIGSVSFARREWSKAEDLLGRAVRLYPKSTEAAGAEFMIGRCLWFCAGKQNAIAKDQNAPEAQRDAAERRMKGLLERARQVFVPLEEKLLKLGEKEPLSEIDRQALRKAGFAAAECDFFLENFQTAIIRYERLRKQYAGEVFELVALSQLWHCYATYLNKSAKGDEILTTLRKVLKKLPDEKFDGSSSIHKREFWENWLKRVTETK